MPSLSFIVVKNNRDSMNFERWLMALNLETFDLRPIHPRLKNGMRAF